VNFSSRSDRHIIGSAYGRQVFCSLHLRAEGLRKELYRPAFHFLSRKRVAREPARCSRTCLARSDRRTIQALEARVTRRISRYHDEIQRETTKLSSWLNGMRPIRQRRKLPPRVHTSVLLNR